MTPFDDDELARALARVPVGEYAPLERLQDRARQLQVRRRLAGTGIALAAALAVAVPSALALTGGDGDTVGPAPARTPPSTPSPAPDLGCPATSTERYDAAEPLLSAAARDVDGPNGVPDELRLLWPAGTATAPDTAIATDLSELNAAVESFYADCPPLVDQGLLLLDVDDDVVTRAVQIRRTGGRHVVDPANARVREIGASRVLIDDTGVPEDDQLSAEWEHDGISWTVEGDPLSEDELSELVWTMRVVDGRVDLSEWPIAGDADHAVEMPGSGAGTGDFSYEVHAGAVTLSVRREESTPWLGAMPGSVLTEVAGEPAMVSEMALGAGWAVRWRPSPGVVATLSADLGPDELLLLAGSIAPVTADDPRLLDAWTSTTQAP